MTTEPERRDRLTLGTVGRAHGIRGEVRLHLHNAASTALVPGLAVQLQHADTVRIIEVVAVAKTNEPAIRRVHFDRIDSREAADALRGATVTVARGALPPLEADEYYHVDLVGCVVTTPAGRAVGRVRTVHTTNIDVLEVVTPGDVELLVPVTADFVVTIDVAGRSVVVVEDLEDRFVEAK